MRHVDIPHEVLHGGDMEREAVRRGCIPVDAVFSGRPIADSPRGDILRESVRRGIFRTGVFFRKTIFANLFIGEILFAKLPIGEIFLSMLFSRGGLAELPQWEIF